MTDRLEEAARAVLSETSFWYVAGGAGSGATMRANRAAFDRPVPRMPRDCSTTVLGTAMPAPLLLAPIGVQSIVHPDGELATARAAAELGVPTVLSTAASHTLEEVAEASGDGPRWYQLYWPIEDAVTASLLGRARAAGYTVLVVTLDTWLLGWRPHDLDRAYLPFLRGIGAAIPFSDPAFRAGLARPPEEDLPAAVAHRQRMFQGNAKVWERLALLRALWDGPIALKGIQHPDDARRALDAGMDGVIVSNHGGRQIDRAVASLQALPAVVGAVGGRAPVLFDSGIRTGADAAVALALGADAVLLGRPFVYGLALGGQAGVREVVRRVLAELRATTPAS
jgi:lactate 2-monooxygenase